MTAGHLVLLLLSVLSYGRLAFSVNCVLSGTYSQQAANAAAGACTTIVLSSLVVPPGVTISFPGIKTGRTIVFRGRTVFKPLLPQGWKGPLVFLVGTDITVRGERGAVLDGQGLSYWDGKGTEGVAKPRFFTVQLTNSRVEGLTFIDSPVQCVSIKGTRRTVFRNITIDNRAGDKPSKVPGRSLAHNTDGFNLQASIGITISDVCVYNQDDCFSIISGRSITFTGGKCYGGNGLSIGSIGNRTNNVVRAVTIKDSQVFGNENGIRIKTIQGATGLVTGITFQNITLSNILKFGVRIHQDYNKGKSSGTATNGVSIDNLTFKDVRGTVNRGGQNVLVYCGKGSCHDWSWTGMDIKGGASPKIRCQNVPAVVTGCYF